ncbi:MAG TPA: DUF996 domain-containing protein [Candidatus Acidoferrum sp.]|nr:DUF996 domain-containing protein [Candidatus Acidoferrum sp.]
MTIESNKILGGVGALLIFVGIFPYVDTFGIVELIGVILVLAALHGFASYYKESGIFSNSIYGIIVGIVGGVVAVAVGLTIVLPNIKDFLLKIYPSWNGSWSTISSFSGMTPNTANISFSDIVPFITAAIVIFVIIWVTAIIASFLIRRSLKQLSIKTSVGLFSTAGLLLLIGAVLIIVVGLGLILMWIASLILAIAFLTMKPKEPVQPQMVTATPSTPTPV